MLDLSVYILHGLAFAHKILKTIPFLDLRAEIAHFPDKGSIFKSFFGSNVSFGAGEDVLCFPASLGETPVVHADPYLNRLLMSYCEQALASRKSQRGPFGLNVENAIAVLLPHGKVGAADIAKRLGASDRFADVKSTMSSGHPEIQIVFNRERAASLGFPVYQLADRVVSKIRGDIATKYSWHDRKIDVLVRSKEYDRNSIEKIRQLIINPESDKPVTLESVADIIIDTGASEIRRIDQ